MQPEQYPTHQRLHLRDAHDAHTVFEAVRQGFLTLAKRRLNETERRRFIQSGAVFVWEEREDDGGLKRWTGTECLHRYELLVQAFKDGRVWGQSRMREPYLFYDEKLPSDGGSMPRSNGSVAYRFVDGMGRNSSTSSAFTHQDRSAMQHSGLIKQTYSAHVAMGPSKHPRKWHLISYFTYADLPNLPTVEQDPLLRKIIVPPGIYSAPTAKSRLKASHAEYMNGDSSYDRRGSFSSPHPPVSPTLPPINQAFMFHEVPPKRPSSSLRNLSEDQRIIQVLNSNHRM